MNPSPTPQKAPRMEWLYSMPGFTMILVVAFHVGKDGFMLPTEQSASQPLLQLFRMPLFFFISGFLAYRVSEAWSLRRLATLLGKKLRIQVVPTLVFFTLFIVIVRGMNGHSWWYFFWSPFKSGYWFTIALLYMFIVYYVFAYLESLLKRRSWVPVALLFALAVAAYQSCYLPQWFSWGMGRRGEVNEWVINSSLRQAMLFFPFFVLGNIFHRYRPQAARLLDSRWFFPAMVLLAVVCLMEFFQWKILRMGWRSVPLTLSRLSLLMIVLASFRHYAPSLTKAHIVGRTLQFVGRRTLDVYLLHFFFIPHLPGVGDFFRANGGNFLGEVVATTTVGVVVVAFCLLVSAALRVSPFLTKQLFGR